MQPFVLTASAWRAAHSPGRLGRRPGTCLALLTVSTLLLIVSPPTQCQVSIFHDRPAFVAALSGTPISDGFESYPLGTIALGDVRGDFIYSFDPIITLPAVVAGGNGGQALAGTPSDVFVGGDSVTLTAGTALSAFGADFLYAPSFDAISSDIYRIGIADGIAAGQFAGNLDSIDPGGGLFFLGLIASPGSEFAGANLFSVQLDPNTVVPAYQVDNLIYALKLAPAPPGVPEPGPIVPIAAIGAALLLLRSPVRSKQLNDPHDDKKG